MGALIDKVRAPYAAKLGEKLAVTEGLLYRRGNFNGTVDQLILDGLMAEKNAEIAFSPGFRWGTSLLPGQAITLEHLMDQTAITYPYVTVNELTGETIKTILEDVADNLFNPDPVLPAGRRHGARRRPAATRSTRSATMGSRITRMTLARQAARRGEEIQGRRLGAGLGGGEGRGRRADLGRDGALPARAEDDRAARAQPAAGRRRGRQSRDGLAQCQHADRTSAGVGRMHPPSRE